MQKVLEILVCFIAGMGAGLSADVKKLNRITGVVLTILGIIMFIV